MNKKIKSRTKIFIVEEITNDAGWLLSRNVKAFTERDAAEYYMKGLNNKNTDLETTYQVSELDLIETAN